MKRCIVFVICEKFLLLLLQQTNQQTKWWQKTAKEVSNLPKRSPTCYSGDLLSTIYTTHTVRKCSKSEIDTYRPTWNFDTCDTDTISMLDYTKDTTWTTPNNTSLKLWQVEHNNDELASLLASLPEGCHKWTECDVKEAQRPVS